MRRRRRGKITLYRWWGNEGRKIFEKPGPWWRM